MRPETNPVRPRAAGPDQGSSFRGEPTLRDPWADADSSLESTWGPATVLGTDAASSSSSASSSAPSATAATAASSGLGWFDEGPPPGRPGRPQRPRAGRSVVRLFRTYVGARAVVGVLLALLHFGSSVVGAAPQAGALLVSGLYALEVLALAFWMWSVGRSRRHVGPPGRTLIALTVGVDAIAFTALLAMDSSTSFNFGALLVLPVLMAGVVMPRREALAAAAALTLALLAQAWSSALQVPAGPSPWLAAGLAGIGLFAIAWLSGELAMRLLREERSALDNREQARRQALLNRLVIEETGEGVLVLNRQRRVLAANPAARALLGLQSDPVNAAQPWLVPQAPWSPLLEAVERAHAQGRWPAAGQALAWEWAGASASKVRARIRFTRLDPADDAPAHEVAAEDLCVLWLEDERAVQSRVQQEKLAAMGRMSAGIAHEIRNPLAAMAQATELLAEDGLAGPQARLVSIMTDNVQRLRRLVDDMLDALPAAAVEARPVEAVAVIRAVVAEWARTARVAPALVELVLPAAGLQVLFDPEHLRRVLVNLLENAVRHASAEPSSVRLALIEDGPSQAILTLSNDGPPVPPEVEMHLFEPFFSTRSRGSGLGLYICKELCERHGASIRLLVPSPLERHRTAFEVRLQRPAAVPDPGEARP